MQTMTQWQHLHHATRSLAERDLAFLAIMRSTPITREEYDQLVLARPDLWARYAPFFGRTRPR